MLTHSLYWAPRVLAILFAIFISLFALDVFNEGYGFWESIAAFAIHLIPTVLLFIVLAVAWRWGWVGGLLFTLLGVAYLVMAWGKVHWTAFVFISGPLFLIAVLFLVDWLHRWHAQPGGPA